MILPRPNDIRYKISSLWSNKQVQFDINPIMTINLASCKYSVVEDAFRRKGFNISNDSSFQDNWDILWTDTVLIELLTLN